MSATPVSIFKTIVAGEPSQLVTGDGDALAELPFTVVDASATIAQAVAGTMYFVTVAGSNLAITKLPVPAVGAWVYVKRIDASGAGTFTINPNGSETIDGASTKTLAAGGTHGCWLVSDGTNWFSITTAG